MTWTRFMDMSSGGGSKLDWDYIYIEAPEDEAKSVFYAKLGRNPDRVTCTCCGADYSTSESETLEDATGYDRNLRQVRRVSGGRTAEYRYIEPDEKVPDGFELDHDEYRSKRPQLTLDQYLSRRGVLAIRATEIKPEDRTCAVPDEGYVWRG